MQRGDPPSVDLRRSQLHPRKSLGQHFLQDPHYLSLIAEAVGATRHVEVLEIGAGTGALTQLLAIRARRVVAVEVDDSLMTLLRRRFSDYPNVELVHSDARLVDPVQMFDGEYTVAGNIPYYITGTLIRHYLEQVRQPAAITFLVQREVAERMCATPGRMSMLAVSVQYYASVRIVVRIPAGAFYPPPKVESAVVHIVPHRSWSVSEVEPFFTVVRAGFSMKRKQIANCLLTGLSLTRQQVTRLLLSAALDGTRRAETLSIDEWITLTNEWRCRA